VSILSREQVLARLETRVRAAGGPVAFARRHALSHAYVGDVLATRRGPGPGILRALGLRPVETSYETVEEAPRG
jgi:hypothetical protein